MLLISMEKALAEYDRMGGDALQGMHRKLWQRCESPAERKLLHVLRKAYSPSEISGQVPIAGYRVDFVTADGIGWEIDGKQWHNSERDEQRDSCILATRQIVAIIRIPAAALHYCREGCMGCFEAWTRRKFPHTSQPAGAARAIWAELADEGSDTMEEYANGALHGDAFCLSANAAEVGPVTAFVDACLKHVTSGDTSHALHRFTLRHNGLLPAKSGPPITGLE